MVPRNRRRDIQSVSPFQSSRTEADIHTSSEKNRDRYLSEAETIREISRGVGRKHANDNEEVTQDEVDKVATDMIAAMHEKGFDTESKVGFCQRNVNEGEL